MYSWVWFGLLLDCYIRGNGAILNPIDAVIFSVSLKSLQLAFGIQASLCSAIKLYQMKEAVLDIPNPWDAGDDRLISGTRIMIILTNLLLFSVMSSANIYPHLYFLLVGDNISFAELPYGTVMFEHWVRIFFAVPALTFILDCCCGKKETQVLATKMERKFQYIVFLMIICSIIGGIFINVDHKFKDKILIIGESLVAISCVLVPLGIIVSSHPLMQYSQRIAFDHFSTITGELRHCYDQIRTVVRHYRRPTQIVPIV